MLSQRVYTSVRSLLPVSPTAANARAFSVLAAARSQTRAPALADITPNGAAKFVERQKEHRAGVIAAQQKKEQDESEFPTLENRGRRPNRPATTTGLLTYTRRGGTGT